MNLLRHITFTCIVLFVLNQSVQSLTCHVCNACKEPFDPTTTNKTTLNGLGYQCVKVWTRHYVRREISTFCPEFHVGGAGIWCCQTDLCNNATRMISIITVWISVIAGILMKFL